MVSTTNPIKSLKFSIANILSPEFGNKQIQVITTTTGSIASAFCSNGLLSSSRDHLHLHHLYAQLQSNHHIRPRSADDDSQSESSATTGGPDSPANSNLLPQNSPLECLYELTNKAFDRTNGHKSVDGSSDHLNIFSNRPPPKKKRKSRTAFTNTQIFELERKFIQQRYLSPADRDDLASRLGLTGPQVITWFQNRRAKQKREVEETKNDLQNHVKTMYYPDIYDNIQDLSMLKVPDIRASLQFHSKSP